MFSNGGNSFGALAMEDDQPTAGPSTQVIEGDELDVDWLKLVRTNHEVDVRVSDKVDLEDLPNECNLMVVSNNWDLLIVGSNDEIRIHRLSEFHGLLEDAAKDASPVSSPLQTVKLSARPVWIRLAMNEERLVVAMANGAGVYLYKVQDVLNGNTSPYHSFASDIPQQLLDVLPNTAPITTEHARYVTLLGKEGLVIADVENRQLASPLPGPFTCASWSAKGKQIVVGTPSGKLVQYTPEGTAKAEIPSPPDLDAYYPISVQWLENDLFFVSYAQEGGQPDDPAETYTIHRNKTDFTFTKFFDPLNTMGLSSRAGLHRHFASLKSWGNQTKHIGLTVSGASSEIGVFHGHVSADKEPPKWEVLLLEETARGVLPAAKDGVRDDASVLALALDLTSTKIIQQGIVGGIELPDLPPAPRLLAYTQEGTIISFDIRYPDNGPYPGMIKPQPIPDLSSLAPSIASTPAVETPAFLTDPISGATITPASSAFGSSAFGSTGFGSNSAAKIASTFGSSAFGHTSGSAFGSSSKPAAFGASAFGQSSTQPSSETSTASAFGSSSKPGAFSGFGQSSSSSSGFGQSAFGQSAKPAAFGLPSTPSTPSAFGSSTTPTSTPAKPSAFGTTPTPVSAFGSSTPKSKPAAFGASSTPASAFGATSSPASGFGQSAFGQSSKPTTSTSSAFGSSSTPSAFGATSVSSNSSTGFAGFGSSNKSSSASSGFGSSAFGQTAKPEDKKEATAPPFGSGGSAFGSSSAFGGNGSAFGSSSAFGQSAFGQKQSPAPSTETPKPAFGGFGPKSDERSTPTSTPASAFAGFGQNPASSAETQKSAFASFGSPSTQSLAFGAFGQSKPSTPVPEPTKNATDDDFGLGGFGTALDSSTKPAGIPGLADSPPGSPVFGSNKKPSGLEDDTPPNSPPTKPAQLKPAVTPSSSPSFIKPATAFGGAPSVGGFGQSSKPSTPAFGSGSTPSAFATTPSSSPSAFGSSAFGKPSTIGSSSPSAFGSSAFGQSSVPAGFGKSSTPANAKPIGNISGGFGAFGAKTEGETKPSGFGGFASTGKSVFGGDVGKDKKPSGFGGFGTSAPSVFGGVTDTVKKEEKPTNVFGTNTVSTPSSEIPAAILAEKPETVPQVTTEEKEEEVEGFDVPETAPRSKEGSTTPTATPVKKASDVSSTTPESTPSKSLEHVEATTPSEPTKPTENATPDEHVYNVEIGATFAQGEESEGESYEVYNEENDDQEGEYTEEDYEEEYEGEDDYEDEEEEYDEDEEEETESSPPRRRRSSSIPPDMSPIKEEVSDDLVSEEAEEEGQEGGEDEEDEGEYEEEASKVESETSTTRSLTKSPPTWFAKPVKADKVESGPVSPTPGSEGASLFSRLSPSPSSSPVSSPKDEQKEPIAATPSPDQSKLAPSFSFKHASRTPSPLAAPPENASTTPESSPAKPPANPGSFGAKPAVSAEDKSAKAPTPPTFGLLGTKPAEQTNKEEPKSATSAFGLFGYKSTENDKDLSSAPPAFAGFGNKPVESKKEETKPAPGAFSLFGAKPTDQAKDKPESPASSTGAFNFFGKTDVETQKPISPAPSPAPPAGGFSLFGNKPSEAAKSETPSSLFSSAKTVPPLANESSKSALGLGLGRPGSSFTSSPIITPVEEKKPQLFGTSATPVSSVAKATTTPVPPAVPSKFTLPVREAVSLPPARPDNGSKSMGAIMEKIIVALDDDIKNLKAVLDANAKYHQSFNVTGLPQITMDSLPQHDIVSFSSINQLTSIVQDLTKESANLRGDDDGAEPKLAELQSRMVKTDMKTGQADKFLKARQDPSFAKVMQVKDLSPEQAASQMKLRKAVQIAESKIEELNASISGLKRRAENREQGRGISQLPPLERVQRSVRNIDAAIRDRQQTIDELSRRVGSIRLSSPSRTGSPAPSLRNTPRKSTIVNTTPKAINLQPTKEILRDVEVALNTDNSRLSGKLEKLKYAKLTKLDNQKDKKRSATSGVVMIDALPLPGQLPPSFIKPKSSPSLNESVNKTSTTNVPSTPSLPLTNGNTTSTSTSTPSPSSFGGIKFNLDPGNISDLAKSTSGISTHRGGSSGGSGSRSHTSAAKFIPSQSSPSSSSFSGSPLGGGGLFEFKKDDMADQNGGKSKPSGFFSFSGFGAK